MCKQNLPLVDVPDGAIISLLPGSPIPDGWERVEYPESKLPIKDARGSFTVTIDPEVSAKIREGIEHPERLRFDVTRV